MFAEAVGVLHALDARTGAELWRHRDRYGPYRGSAHAADGRTFVAVQFGEAGVPGGRQRREAFFVPR